MRFEGVRWLVMLEVYAEIEPTCLSAWRTRVVYIILPTSTYFLVLFLCLYFEREGNTRARIVVYIC